MQHHRPIGVVLTDLGGPADLGEIGPYLARFFSSPAILPVPWPLRGVAARLISTARTRRASEKYRAIGGGSPMDRELRRQTQALGELLREPFVVRHAFRFTRPFVRTVLEELAREGVVRIVATPTFPQFSFTTVGECVDELSSWARRLGLGFCHTPSFPEGEGFVRCLCELSSPCAGGSSWAVLVAHGLPESHIRRGDPYLDEVRRTAGALGERLMEQGFEGWSLSFQSRLGPVRWLSPFVEDELRRLATLGTGSVTVVPISFGCENLETLYDLDIEASQLAKELGITTYDRVSAPGAHPLFIGQLAELVRDAASAQGWWCDREDENGAGS